MKQFSNTEEWIKKQQLYNQWLWGIIGLLVALPVFSGSVLGMAYIVGGASAVQVAAAVLGVLFVLLVVVALVRWLMVTIQGFSIQTVQATTLGIIAHQASDDRGEVLRKTVDLLSDTEHDANQRAYAIIRQADKLASEKVEALHSQPFSTNGNGAGLLSQFKLDEDWEENES